MKILSGGSCLAVAEMGGGVDVRKRERERALISRN